MLYIKTKIVEIKLQQTNTYQNNLVSKFLFILFKYLLIIKLFALASQMHWDDSRLSNDYQDGKF